MAAADSASAVALAKQATAEAMSAALAEPGTPPASPHTDGAAQATREKDVKVLADLQRALDKKVGHLANREWPLGSHMLTDGKAGGFEMSGSCTLSVLWKLDRITSSGFSSA